MRACCALLAMGAYAVPMMVGIVSQATHEIDHLLIELEHRELEAPGGRGEPAASRGGDGFVHAHGEEGAHAHGGALGKLLVAAQQTEEQQSDAAVSALELVGHLPAAGASIAVIAGTLTSSPESPSSTAADVSLRPPLPPPRA